MAVEQTTTPWIKTRKEEVNGSEYQMRTFVGKVRGIRGVLWVPRFYGCGGSSGSSGLPRPCAPASHTDAVPPCSVFQLFKSGLKSLSPFELYCIYLSSFSPHRLWWFLLCISGQPCTRACGLENVRACRWVEPRAALAAAGGMFHFELQRKENCLINTEVFEAKKKKKKGMYSRWCRNSRKKFHDSCENIARERKEAQVAEVFIAWKKLELWFYELVYQPLPAHRRAFQPCFCRQKKFQEQKVEISGCIKPVLPALGWCEESIRPWQVQKRVTFLFQGTVIWLKLFFTPSGRRSPFPRHPSQRVRWMLPVWVKPMQSTDARVMQMLRAGWNSWRNEQNRTCSLQTLTCISYIIPALLLCRHPLPVPSCSPC